MRTNNNNLITVRKIIWIVGLSIAAMFIFIKHCLETAILRRRLKKL